MKLNFSLPIGQRSIPIGKHRNRQAFLNVEVSKLKFSNLGFTNKVCKSLEHLEKLYLKAKLLNLGNGPSLLNRV